MGTAALALRGNDEISVSDQVVILLMENMNVRSLIRDVLEGMAVEKIRLPRDEKECLQELARSSGALLILDWEIGQQAAVRILQRCNEYRTVPRPVFLVCSAIEKTIVGTAAEYGVSHLHSGEITRKDISTRLGMLMKKEGGMNGIHRLMAPVIRARQQADWAESCRLLENLCDEWPDRPQFSVELCADRMAAGQWHEAATLLHELGMEDDSNPRVMHLRARCLMQEGEFGEAAELMERADLFNPFHAERLVDLGHCLLQIDNVRRAHESFTRAMELDPALESARTGKGQCLLQSGEVNEALELLRDVSGPRETAALFNSAAILCIRHERFREGMSLYETAIGLLGDKKPRTRARLIFNLGLGYLKQRRRDEALECFERAAVDDPHFEKSRYNAAVLARLLGRAPVTTEVVYGAEGAEMVASFETEV